MKLFSFAAAALVALTGLAPAGIVAEASAQRTVIQERTVVRHTDRRPGYRRNVRTKRVCRNVYRNNHRQRVCRTVRYNR